MLTTEEGECAGQQFVRHPSQLTVTQTAARWWCLQWPVSSHGATARGTRDDTGRHYKAEIREKFY